MTAVKNLKLTNSSATSDSGGGAVKNLKLINCTPNSDCSHGEISVCSTGLPLVLF